MTFGLLSFSLLVAARDIRCVTGAFSTVIGWVGAMPRGSLSVLHKMSQGSSKTNQVSVCFYVYVRVCVCVCVCVCYVCTLQVHPLTCCRLGLNVSYITYWPLGFQMNELGGHVHVCVCECVITTTILHLVESSLVSF